MNLAQSTLLKETALRASSAVVLLEIGIAGVSLVHTVPTLVIGLSFKVTRSVGRNPAVYF